MWNPIKSFNSWRHNIETARLLKEQVQIEQARNLLYHALSSFAEQNSKIKGLKVPWDSTKPDSLQLTTEQLTKVKNDLPRSILDVISLHKIADIKTDRCLKDIFFNSFGMDETWPLARNSIGLFMVHSPEYPTYFIPAFTQAKATGEAKELKKGEGPRGFLTGGLEGIAIGALVSGRVLKAKEMFPYIALGIAMQMVSCTIFPWLGEKIGRHLYHKNLNENSTNPVSKPKIEFTGQPQMTTFNKIAPTLNYKSYNTTSVGLKI